MGIMRTVEELLFKNYTIRTRGKQSTEAKQAAAANCTILAIDDDPAFLESMRWLLRDAGYTVLTSSSGAKGLDMLRYAARDIRAVLLDYNMPKFNGEETLLHVRKLSPQAKVIALTGQDIDRLPESFRTGVDKFIQKPCRSGALVESLSELLQENRTAAETWPS